MRHAALLAVLALAGCDVTVHTGGDAPLGTFTCQAIKDDACVGPTDRFPVTADAVHMTYRTKDIPKKGDVYLIKWIAEDVGAASAPETLIDSIEKIVPDDSVGATTYFVNSNLTRPTNGWPPGKYRVEIERAGKVETTARFTIQ
jgi:hypothetical protein